MAIKPKTTAKATIVSKILLIALVINYKQKKHHLTKNQIEVVLSEFLEETKKALIKGEEIRFPGYYSLKTAISKARMAMNLQTGEKMSIPAKRVPKAKFSIDLKTEIAKKK